MHESYQMIDLIIMGEVWSLKMNNKALYNNLKIVKTWFVLEFKKLGLKAFNRKIWWEIN